MTHITMVDGTDITTGIMVVITHIGGITTGIMVVIMVITIIIGITDIIQDLMANITQEVTR